MGSKKSKTKNEDGGVGEAGLVVRRVDRSASTSLESIGLGPTRAELLEAALIDLARRVQACADESAARMSGGGRGRAAHYRAMQERMMSGMRGQTSGPAEPRVDPGSAMRELLGEARAVFAANRGVFESLALDGFDRMSRDARANSDPVIDESDTG